jgi:hypothetical protein
MSRSLFITASILALASVTGCSSSSSGTTAADSGTGTTGGDSSTAVDSGTGGGGDSSTGDDSSTTENDSGTTPTGDSGITPTGDAGVCTALATVTAPPAYQNFAPTQACTGTQVTGAINSCFGSGTGCTAWIASNESCAACALGIGPDGGATSAPSAIECFSGINECFLNTDACIASKDGNTTCASADYELQSCLYSACSSTACVADFTGAQGGNTADNTAYSNCEDSAAGLACTTQNSTWNTACGGADSADGGSFDSCVAQTTTDAIRILNILCNPQNQ